MTIKYTPNQKINNVTFLKEIETYIALSGAKTRKAKFKCYCDKIFTASIASVKEGNTQSCGCLIFTSRRIIHGFAHHPLYNTWVNMKQRCYNSNDKKYKCYGGRGIIVCKEWLNNPEVFIKWALVNGYKKGLTIDRRNNDGNYEPSNCRFVTYAVNNQNSSRTKLNWKMVTEIRNAKLLIPGLTNRELAEAYKTRAGNIRAILSNRTWVVG